MVTLFILTSPGIEPIIYRTNSNIATTPSIRHNVAIVSPVTIFFFFFSGNELAILKRRDCKDVAQQGKTQSGLYDIVINGRTTSVYCDLRTAGGNWLVRKKHNNKYEK